jgi:hypothetical protein
VTEFPEPVLPTLAVEDYSILVSRRSSWKDIKLKLQKKHPDYLSDSLEFLITENGKVFISHVSSHADLQEAEGVADVDVLAQGSMNVFNDGGKLRPVVRPKSCEISGTEYFRALERRIAKFVLTFNPTNKEVIWP